MTQQRVYQSFPQVRVRTELGTLDFNFLRAGVVTVRSLSGGDPDRTEMTINRGTYASLSADVYDRPNGWSVERLSGSYEKPLTDGARKHATRVIVATIEALLHGNPSLEWDGERAETSNRIRGLESKIAEKAAELAALQGELEGLLAHEATL